MRSRLSLLAFTQFASVSGRSYSRRNVTDPDSKTACMSLGISVVQISHVLQVK
jgi:hypothetical protein